MHACPNALARTMQEQTECYYGTCSEGDWNKHVQCWSAARDNFKVLFPDLCCALVLAAPRSLSLLCTLFPLDRPLNFGFLHAACPADLKVPLTRQTRLNGRCAQWARQSRSSPKGRTAKGSTVIISNCADDATFGRVACNIKSPE